MFEEYPDVLTVNVLQKLLSANENYNISKKTLYKMINNNKIKAKKIGRTWYISKQSLINFFN